ncbi:hypothetical protein [Paraburkholderia sp.]|uniref:hypothetical protein n=1 Tax=Paraburkholderia sp. TaxID=1926495 RepID=UPI00239ED71B|nr:hypothetical protein [Paraburkholderia sp.]MDE1181772.1 hypothetical protein [Paraburkholderia sp.]
MKHRHSDYARDEALVLARMSASRSELVGIAYEASAANNARRTLPVTPVTRMPSTAVVSLDSLQNVPAPTLIAAALATLAVLRQRRLVMKMIRFGVRWWITQTMRDIASARTPRLPSPR